MKRPDLSPDPLYDGWQVLDPTPQEKSSGEHLQHTRPWRQQYTAWGKIIHVYFRPQIIRILRSCSRKIFSIFLTINLIIDY